MDIRIKTTDYHMTPEVSDYVDERVRAVEKLLGDRATMARCEVEVGRAAGHPKQGDIWRAEINVFTDGNHFRAESNEQSVNAAIDEAKDEMLRQLRKNKRFHTRLLRRGGVLAKRILRFGR